MTQAIVERRTYSALYLGGRALYHGCADLTACLPWPHMLTPLCGSDRYADETPRSHGAMEGHHDSRLIHAAYRRCHPKARDARVLYNPRAEHAVRSRGSRAYHKQARQAAEHAQSRTGVSRCGHCLGYRLTVTAQTPSLVTDAKEGFVNPPRAPPRRSRRVVKNSRRRRYGGPS